MVALRCGLYSDEGKSYKIVIGDRVIARALPTNLPSYLNAYRKIMREYREERLQMYEAEDLIKQLNGTLNDDLLVRLYSALQEGKKKGLKGLNRFVESVFEK